MSDLQKLEEAFFNNLTIIDGEYGGIGLDPKRPFGNSDVEGDILEIIGKIPEGDDGEDKCWSSDQRDYASELYKKLPESLRHQYGTATRKKKATK